MNELLNKDSTMSGIYRAKLILIDNTPRVYIPGIMNINPFNENGTVDESIIEKNKNAFPVAQWCAFDLQSIEMTKSEKFVWVMFENGDAKRPVIISLNSVVVYSSSGNSSSGDNDTNSATGGASERVIIDGEWISGHSATTYGYNGDDNGICGWTGQNYHNISGCHVAIPIYCISFSSKYNKTYAEQDYPEFSGGYGTVLEVRSPDTGKSVVAVVADCGSFGIHGTCNHNAALDLPPNTFKSLGLSTGTYKIEYRVIGHVDSWDGSQLTLSQFNK